MHAPLQEISVPGVEGGQAEEHDGHEDVKEVKDGEAEHQVVERFLSNFLGEDDYAQNISKAANQTKQHL